MINKYDISNFVPVLTEQSVLSGIVERVKERRKELGLTQAMLAQRTGVSYASIRRFERTGEISFTSLLSLARVLQSLADFNLVFGNEIIPDLKEYNNGNKRNSKARRKI